MNIALINKNTGICENIAVFENMETAQNMFENIFILSEIKEGFGIGDKYENGIWTKGSAPEPKKTPQQKREEAYETLLYKEDGATLILWEGEAITVDIANKKWLDYSAEGSTIAKDLSTLIVRAKEYIRELYPDS